MRNTHSLLLFGSWIWIKINATSSRGQLCRLCWLHQKSSATWGIRRICPVLRHSPGGRAFPLSWQSEERSLARLCRSPKCVGGMASMVGGQEPGLIHLCNTPHLVCSQHGAPPFTTTIITPHSISLFPLNLEPIILPHQHPQLPSSFSSMN